MNINLSKWMEKISDDTKLFSLNIPAAHDCAANHIMIPSLFKCQDTDIYGLLSLGIRVLDLRVENENNNLVTVHRFARARVSSERKSETQNIGDILKHCKRFLEENPGETVVLQFKNDSEKHMEECFDIFYHRYLIKDKNLWFLENRIPCLGEVRGKIVLLRRCEIYCASKPYNAENSGIDLSRWINQSKRVPDSLSLETHSKDNDVFIIQDRYNYAPAARWSKCIKPFLDSRNAFDGKYILCYVSTAGGLKGPKKNAEYINSRLFDYEFDKGSYYGVIYFDFPTKEITKKIIEINF